MLGGFTVYKTIDCVLQRERAARAVSAAAGLSGAPQLHGSEPDASAGRACGPCGLLKVLTNRPTLAKHDHCRPTFEKHDHCRPTFAKHDYCRPTFAKHDYCRLTLAKHDHCRLTLAKHDHCRLTLAKHDHCMPTTTVSLAAWLEHV